MKPNTSRLPRAARLAAPALAALALTMAFAGPASADPSYVLRQGADVRFSALPGEQNTVRFFNDSGTFTITDTTSPLVAGPGCSQVNPNRVTCGATGGVTRIQAAMGNLNDVVTNDTSAAADIDGGAGEDRLIGGGGADRFTDPDGWNAATGTTTTFDGRGGNDTIVSKNGGFDRILCGVGFDIVVADQAALDAVPLASGCEFVIR